MSNVLPFQGKRLVMAIDLGDAHMSRTIRIGNVEGTLVGLVPHRDRIDAVLIVGGSRAIFPLALDAHVEVGPTTTKEQNR